MNRKYQQHYYTSNPSPLFSPSIPPSTSTTNYQYSNNYNRYVSPHRYRQPVLDNRPDPRAQPNQFNYASNNKSVSSKIGQLNERVLHDTNLFKMRNGQRRNNCFRSNSNDLRRSRMSADQKRTKNQYYNPPHAKQYTDAHSMSSSRASNQFLCQPIISHNYIRQPNGQMYEQLPSFKKINSKQYQFNVVKPVLQSQLGPTLAQKSMFAENNYRSPLNLPNQYHIKHISKKESSENYDEFLDMDFYSKQKKSSIQQIRASTESIDFRQEDPVSPVTPMHRNDCQKFEQNYSEKQLQMNAKKNSKVPIDNQIRNVLEKVDQEGRLITIFLVGLGILLVIYQAIR